jgi:type IX secretion system PorP/SprF family membrane protein
MMKQLLVHSPQLIVQRQRSMVNSQRSMVNGQWTMDNSLWSKIFRLWTMDYGLSTIVFLLLTTTVSYSQQNIVTAQYLYNGLLINPAYAGSHVQLSATLTYRNQWVNFDGAPITATLGVHSSFYKGKVGIGALVTSDRIGSYTNTGVFGSYAYIIKNRMGGSFSMGVQVGANNYKADYSALNLRSTLDPRFVNISEIKPNVGAGIFYYDKKKFFGVSVPGLISYDKLFNNSLQPLYVPRYAFINAGLKLRANPRSEKIMIHPSMLVRIQDGTPVSVDFNLSLVFDEQISLGSSYRTGDGITTFANLKITEKLSVGYFYDWITSDVRNYSRGSHELMLNFRTRIKNVHKDLDCPHLFSH